MSCSRSRTFIVRSTVFAALCLGLLAVVTPASAQHPTLIANTDGRKTISLDGQWQTIIDPYETGYYDYRYQPSANGYFKDAKPRTKSDLIEYDFDTSESLTVPGDWNTQRERLLLYEGTIWYNLVRDKSNSLIVKVDNKRRRDAVPTLITDWWNYGGLTRQVKLVETPATFVEDYFIQLQKGSRNQVSGWLRLNGDKLKQRVTVRIPEARIDKSFTTDANGYAEINFNADLTLWSPDNPKLYDVVIEAETDRVQDQIGFRSIESRGTEILLNGRPIFLRGVCIHEEAPFRGGRAYSREDAITLLGWAKELGANFVRLAHYPHNEFMIKEADKLGIMIWSEIPVYWTILWESPATLENARNQLSEMITRDKNRAAVIVWSMANETPVGDARLLFLKKLIEHARSLDPGRLISAAMERHYTDEKTQMIDDPLGEYLDVLGCNEYVGWYDGLPEKTDRLEWKMKYQKPLIMSEFGAEAPYGNHGDPLTRWTEEYQENFYQHQVSMLKRISFLRGTCPWILMDFRSPRRPLPGIQDFHNRKGLISDRGEKKKAFYVMQKYYHELELTLPK